ncbi:MAG TPA: serine hydrolase domain-containing protein [Pirellulaceae bacterium]|jgi:N-acyl-D-amino-acid deacylase
MALDRLLRLVAIWLIFAVNAAADEVSVSGIERTECTSLDEWMKSFLTEHKIPGGSLAVMRDGKLVYARGFGWADREAKTPVRPDSLFRIASVSKPITAATILKLAEEKRLKLDDKVLDYLPFNPHFEADANFDERWRQITLAHCLSHTGGWDRDKSYDPMFQAIRMTKSLKIDLPITPPSIIRYQLGQPLDFDPGERYAYSNFGYSILGRIIEKVTGQPYEDHVRRAVLRPLGIERARIGRSLERERFDGEVKYYVVNDAKNTATTGPGAGEAKVPIPYGVWRQETLDSHGGWIASAPDLVRFAAAFDLVESGKSIRSKFLSPASVEQMFSRHADIPSADDKAKITSHYGYGWLLKDERDADGKTTMVARHGGALPCTAASLMHFPNSLNVAVLFNLGQSADGKFLGRRMEEPLTRRIREIKTWPSATP